MSEQITFTGVVLKSFTRDRSGGTAKFHATFTKSVADQMGWHGLVDGMTSAKLEGELAASTVTLQPKDGALSKWQIQFAASSVAGFEGLRLESERQRGKGWRYELRFSVDFADQTACRYLEEFITHVGDAKSTLVVAYTKAAEQTTLGIDDDVRATEEQHQAAMEL